MVVQSGICSHLTNLFWLTFIQNRHLLQVQYLARLGWLRGDLAKLNLVQNGMMEWLWQIAEVCPTAFNRCMWYAQDMLRVIICNWWNTERFNQQLMTFCLNDHLADWQFACSDSYVNINWVCCYTAAVIINIQFISINYCTFLWSARCEHFGICVEPRWDTILKLLFLVENYVRRNLRKMCF